MRRGRGGKGRGIRERELPSWRESGSEATAAAGKISPQGLKLDHFLCQTSNFTSAEPNTNIGGPNN